MAEEIKIKAIGHYNGHSVKANNMVDLSFKFDYDELFNVMELLKMLGENITVAVKRGDNKPQVLGTFGIKELKVDSEGKPMVRLNSTTDYVDIVNFGDLIHDILTVLFKTKLESEESDDV